MSSHKRITILENGPNLVSGSVPIAHQTIGANDNGESTEWVEDDHFPPPRNTRSAAAENRTRSRSAAARTRRSEGVQRSEKMKIALIGASGFVGTALLKEALDRGHEVTANVRHPENLPPQAKLRAQKGDVSNAEEVARLVAGHDAVISDFNPGWSNPNIYDLQVKGTQSIINGVKQAGVKRLLFVGVAGSLELKPGVQSVDLPGVPTEYKSGALATREALDMLREETSLEWFFLSPSADLSPGQRTGKFRLGTDQLLKDINRESRISVEDYAMAMIDEVEKPKHISRWFTVGY